MKTKNITKDGITFKVPVIKNLNSKIWNVIKNDQYVLTASSWNCGTTHCRGGWAIVLAGKEGEKLTEYCREQIIDLDFVEKLGKFPSFQFAKERNCSGVAFSMAAELIYLASTGRCPDFYNFDDDEMRESIKRAAARERAKKQKVSK